MALNLAKLFAMKRVDKCQRMVVENLLHRQQSLHLNHLIVSQKERESKLLRKACLLRKLPRTPFELAASRPLSQQRDLPLVEFLELRQYSLKNCHGRVQQQRLVRL